MRSKEEHGPLLYEYDPTSKLNSVHDVSLPDGLPRPGTFSHVHPIITATLKVA